MPITYHYYPRENLLVSWLSENVTDADLRKMYEAVFDKDNCSPGFDELLICEKGTRFDCTNECLAWIAKETGKFHGEAGKTVKSAHVVEKLSHELMSAHYKEISNLFAGETERVKRFYNIPDALQFLGREGLEVGHP